MELTGSVFTNKTLEGYPGRRFQAGSHVADKVEQLACERACKLFGADHANIQSYSGSTANYSVFASVLQPGDRVLSMRLDQGGHQPRHVHYGEQAIYVLEGEAESTVDGVTTRVVPGDLFHWKAGIVHEVRNPLDVPFRHLLVSSPVSEGRDALPAPGGDSPRDVAPDLIYIAAEAVRTQFLETLPYGYALFDGMGNLILKGQSFPEYCRGRCGIDTCPNLTDCMVQGAGMDVSREQVYRCPHGMEVYQYPIFYAGHLLGFIQAGYIRHSGAEDDFVGEVYDVPESVVAGVKALMRRIVKAIRNYCEFEQFRRELSERESQISDARERHSVLMKDLRDTRYAMTDLKINNHFLFNTLNSMASMALDGAARKWATTT